MSQTPEGDDAQPAEEVFDDDDDWLVDDENDRPLKSGKGDRKIPREKSYTGAREVNNAAGETR